MLKTIPVKGIKLPSSRIVHIAKGNHQICCRSTDFKVASRFVSARISKDNLCARCLEWWHVTERDYKEE